jgi:hypothetical protein
MKRTLRPLLLAIALAWLALPSNARAAERVLDRPHYVIHTDLDPQFAEELADRLEAMYGEYAWRLSAFGIPPSVQRMEVYLFRSQADYLRFTDGKIRNSGGLFLPGRNLLAAFLNGQGRQQLRRTLQHEAFHQFAYNAISPDLPIWLNEGLAQFFEEGLWNGAGFALGEVPPRRVRQLQSDIRAKRMIPFGDLLAMTDAQWARQLSASREQGTVQYNQSWAMVHFLVMAHTVRNGETQLLYRSHLIDLLRLLHSGKSADEAFQTAFGNNIPAFEQRFSEYAASLTATPEATMIENQGVLADLMVDFSKQGKHFEDVEAFRKFVVQGHFKLHYHLGELEWDTNPNMNAYFSDLDGNRLVSTELYFSTRTGAALPDLVCRFSPQLRLRTRFFSTASAVDHDLQIEVTQATAWIR